MYSENFKNLGARALNAGSAEQCTFAQIDSELNIRFTDKYQSLLKNLKGSIVFDSGAVFKPKQKSPVDTIDGFQSLEMLYGLQGDSNLIYKNKMYNEQVPEGYVVIGESIGGNQICISREDGKVYFWFHEAEVEDNSLFEIACNVDDFLEGLLNDNAQPSDKREVDESNSFLDF